MTKNELVYVLDKILTDRLSRTVDVEVYLARAAVGKEPLPDKEKCRQLSYQLGVPADVALKIRTVAIALDGTKGEEKS